MLMDISKGKLQIIAKHGKAPIERIFYKPRQSHHGLRPVPPVCPAITRSLIFIVKDLFEITQTVVPVLISKKFPQKPGP
jgi:hypothetical protein